MQVQTNLTYADVVRMQPRKIIQIFHRPGKSPLMKRNYSP